MSGAFFEVYPESVWAVSGLQVHVRAAPSCVSRICWDMSGVLAAVAAKASENKQGSPVDSILGLVALTVEQSRDPDVIGPSTELSQSPPGRVPHGAAAPCSCCPPASSAQRIECQSACRWGLLLLLLLYQLTKCCPGRFSLSCAACTHLATLQQTQAAGPLPMPFSLLPEGARRGSRGANDL